MINPNREPPHSPAAERAVIGTAIVAGPELLPEIQDLAEDDFFIPHHREVWAQIRALEALGSRVDVVSLGDRVKAQGIEAKLPEGRAWLMAAAMEACVPALAVEYAARVRNLAAKRRLIGLCIETAAKSYEAAELDDAVSDLRTGLATIESVAGGKGAIHVSDLMGDVLAEVEARSGMKAADHLANTGIESVDRIIGHFRRGHVVVIGGLSGMGKSSYGRQVILHNATNGVPCVAFSNEMDRGEVTEAIISLRSHVPATNIGRGKLDIDAWKAITKAAGKIAGYPLWIDDRVLTASATCGEAHRWWQKCVVRTGRDYGLIFIDYLNLVPPEGKSENRNREVAKILAQFKRLAKDLRTTVVVVAQLNRKSAIENREPIMTDFRDCGEIESQADVIMCPWREGWSKPGAASLLRPGEPEPARILILKQKGGATGGVDVNWHRERMEFVDQDGRYQQEPPRNFSERGERDE